MTAAVATASTIAALLASIAPAVGATAEVSAVRALTRIANTFAIAGVARTADVPAATHNTIASSGAATTYSAPAADSAACVATGIAPSGRAAAVTTTSCAPACAPAGTTLFAAGGTAPFRAAARLSA
jgi:hypothetical protein